MIEDGKAPLRGAIVGFGFISEFGHVPAYALAGSPPGGLPRQSPRRFEIAAVADCCSARRQRAHAALPDARIYESHEAMIAAEAGRIDFVDVTTPPRDHARVARAALSAGLHVLCEKPLATRGEDARSMARLALEEKRVLFPCHNYKHAPAVKAVRQVLDAGLVGKVRLVTMQTFRNTHAKGVDEWCRDWRREKRISGGGIAMDHGSHSFYLAFDWIGDYPTSITAKMSALGGYDTEDNFSCTMTFPGATATAHLSWTAGVRKVIYTIHGDHGAVRVEDDDVEVAVMTGEPSSGRPVGEGPHQTRSSGTWELKRQRIASQFMDASHVGWFRSMLGQFAEAVDTGDFVSRETQASVRCVELITTAYESALDGSREHALSRSRAA
jgi:predicted dehydrogenase